MNPLSTALAAVSDAVAVVADWAVEQRVKEAELHADTIGSAADTLWDLTPVRKRKDDSEPGPDEVRTAVTWGLAILACRPGGVMFAGGHWCASEHDNCPGQGGAVLEERAGTRESLGAVFTPRFLAEEITVGALEPLVYEPGPLQTADRTRWKLRCSLLLAELKIADASCGSGVFLLAACRYLADRIVEAQHLEAGLPVPDVLPPAAVLAARRRVMARNIYGTDIDPTAVELARLSLALLAPAVPVDLTHQTVCGDTLLGITSWADIAYMSLDHSGPQVFDQGEVQVLRHALQLGRRGAELPGVLADLVVGWTLATITSSKKARAEAWQQAVHAARRAVEREDALPEARMLARQWLDANLPDGASPIRPLHWPLVFPEVFSQGVTPVGRAA